MTSKHCETCTCGCTCGYGGFHEETNPRCELNQPIPKGETTMVRVDGKVFRCECGSNVQTRYFDPEYGEVFKCHGCPREYTSN